MRVWERVVSVDSISLTVDSGQDDVILHGNARHCVQVVVYFNGRDKNGDLLDLSGEEFEVKFEGNDIELINQETGEEFEFDFGLGTIDEITWWGKASRFTLYHHDQLLATSSNCLASETLAKRGKIIYYVYASAQQEYKRVIGAKFNFSNGSTYDTTQDNQTTQFAKISVLRERRYTVADLKPIMFTETAREGDHVLQWDAYIKPKNENWVYSEFDHHDATTDCRVYFASQNDSRYGYYYFMWPIGPEGVYDLKPANGKHWMTINYNKMHGALNLVIIKGDKVETTREEFVIRAYDRYGNEGRFKIDSNDASTDPTEVQIVYAELID